MPNGSVAWRARAATLRRILPPNGSEIVEKVLYLRKTYRLGPIPIVWYLARYHAITISEASVYRLLRRMASARPMARRRTSSGQDHHPDDLPQNQVGGTTLTVLDDFSYIVTWTARSHDVCLRRHGHARPGADGLGSGPHQRKAATSASERQRI